MSRPTNKPSHKSFPICAHFLHVLPHVFCLSVICLPLEIPLTRPNHAEPTDRGARPIIGRPTMSRHWRQSHTRLVRARLSPGAALSSAALFLPFFSFGTSLAVGQASFLLFLSFFCLVRETPRPLVLGPLRQQPQRCQSISGIRQHHNGLDERVLSTRASRQDCRVRCCV